MNAHAYQLRLIVLMLVTLFGAACSGPERADEETPGEKATPPSDQDTGSLEKPKADASEKTAIPQDPPPAPKEELGEPPRLSPEE